MRTLPSPLVALAIAVAAPAALARDINPEGIPVGHRALALGGAYTAVSGDGASLWYNPAGLGGLASKGISANVTVYQWRKQTIDPFARFGDVENTEGLNVKGSGKAESSDFATVPSSLVFSLPLGDSTAKARHGVAAGLFVPDADAYVAKVSRTLAFQGATLAELKARDILDERSYWAGAGYGYDAGAWAIGFSGFAVAHLFQRSVLASAYVNVPDQHLSVIETSEVETTDVQAVIKVGGLYRVGDTLTLGLAVRSPSLARLYSQGSGLAIRSAEGLQGSQQAAFVDRLETEDIKANHRLPVRVEAGLAWRPSPRFLLTGDLHFNGALDSVRVLSAPLLCPPGADGRPQTCDPDGDRTVNLSVRKDRRAVLNGAVGAEIGVSEKWLLRAGVYTDFSAVDDLQAEEPLDTRIDLYSAVLGVGYLGERGSTDIGVIVRRGAGETLSLFNESGKRPQATTTVVGLYLAGSADL